MDKSKVPRETFVYRADEPFIIYNITSEVAERNRHKLLQHWHEELELAYALVGHSIHYIDGQRVRADPGRLVVTNSGSVHSVVPDTESPRPGEIAAVVVLIHRQFLRDNLPQYPSVLFTNDKPSARPEIGWIMGRLSVFAGKERRTAVEALCIRGLLMQLLYYMCLEGTVSQGAWVEKAHNSQKLQAVLVYIEENYSRTLFQSEVAGRFGLSPGYFSRYFKQHTGTTFTQYLTQLRLQKAKEDLLGSGRSVSQVALRNGFADERSFINAFKKQYFATPLQYRKQHNNKN